MKFNKGLDFEKLYRTYFEEHLQDFIKSYIDDYIEFDEVSIQEIMEDNEFTTLKEVRNYLYENYNEDDIYEANRDYIEKQVNKDLQIIYDESFEKVKSTTKNVVNKFNNLVNDIYFNYDIKKSRSWHTSNFPSIYFIVTLKKEDDIEELTIRLSDLHDNNRNDSDIELNWYDLDIDSYKENLVDKLCEILESSFDIEDTIKIYHRLCDSRKENKMIRKIRDTGRADTLEETIKDIANRQYRKKSPLHLNLSQKQLDILISKITYSDDLVKLVNKFVRNID